MSSSTPADRPEPDHVYVTPSRARKATLWWLGGFVMLFVAVFGFVVALFGRVDPLRLQLLTTLPLLMAFASFAQAWSARKLLTKIRTYPHGLEIFRGTAVQAIDWGEIAFASTDSSPMTHQKRLNLFDTAGKKMATITDSFPNFKELVSRVEAEVSARAGEATEVIRMRKARRAALILAGISVPLLLIAVANVFLARAKQRENKMLATSAVPAEATIVRRFIAPNGVTRRLEYEVRDASGETATRNAEVINEYWDSLEGAKTVPVMTVPGEPGYSRLVSGEVPQDEFSENPLVMYGLSIAMGIFCLVCLVMAVI